MFALVKPKAAAYEEAVLLIEIENRLSVCEARVENNLSSLRAENFMIHSTDLATELLGV